MTKKVNRDHVLSVRITENDFKQLEAISELNHETTRETARKALKMILEANKGYLDNLESKDDSKKG